MFALAVRYFYLVVFFLMSSSNHTQTSNDGEQKCEYKGIALTEYLSFEHPENLPILTSAPAFLLADE